MFLRKLKSFSADSSWFVWAWHPKLLCSVNATIARHRCHAIDRCMCSVTILAQARGGLSQFGVFLSPPPGLRQKWLHLGGGFGGPFSCAVRGVSQLRWPAPRSARPFSRAAPFLPRLRAPAPARGRAMGDGGRHGLPGGGAAEGLPASRGRGANWEGPGASWERPGARWEARSQVGGFCSQLGGPEPAGRAS